VLPRVSSFQKWTHLSSLQLADPDFGHPGKIDILLGVDIYAETLLHGRWSGPDHLALRLLLKPALVGFWLEAPPIPVYPVASFHTQLAVAPGGELLLKFWELEVSPNLSPEEHTVAQHFNENHTRANNAMGLLLKNPQAKPLGLGTSRLEPCRSCSCC
jgi:hypothetical protein